MNLKQTFARPEILVFGIVIALVIILSLFVGIPQGTGVNQPSRLAPELSGISSWINSEPLSVEGLRGKVVLVDFWTYSCINCIRTLPYLKDWHQKYKDKGLIIIGVHTPEFEFEKDYDNVKAAVDKYGIEYAVAQDNDYATWQAYENRYWPRKYLIDKEGFIVYDHIGEGGYAETEKKIQELLGSVGDMSTPEDVMQTDFARVASPEVYFGAARNSYLGNGMPNAIGVQELTEPNDIIPNILYLVGEWDFQDEFAHNVNPAKIIYRYRAKSVYLVASAGGNVTLRVLRDGEPLGSEAGADVVSNIVAVGEDRLYRLVEGTDYGEHTLEIIVEKPGLRAFTFTFG